jgi:hypothetical protein
MPLDQLLVPAPSSSRHATKKVVTIRSIFVWPFFGALFGFFFTVFNVQRPCFLGEVGAHLEEIPDYPLPPPPPPLYDGICDPVRCIEFFLFLAFSLLHTLMVSLFVCDFKLIQYYIIRKSLVRSNLGIIKRRLFPMRCLPPVSGRLPTTSYQHGPLKVCASILKTQRLFILTG